MSNYNLTVCLTDLEGAQVQANNMGEQFVLIPINRADLFQSQTNGKVYLNLTMWERKNGPDQYGKTHGVKQSFSQERRQQMGQNANTPFIGHGKPMQPKNPQSQQGYQANPQSQPVYQQTAPQGYQSPFPDNAVKF